MGGEPRDEDGTLMRRVPVIVRSWDGPNSRIGLEMDLSQMPWGPFDALGKRLSILLPASDAPVHGKSTSESQVERALRHVEHAADRCAEFAQLANGNQELWLRSQDTWEWIRRYLTSLWVEMEVEGRGRETTLEGYPQLPNPLGESSQGSDGPEIPPLPGAASTLKVAARALRATPLSVWRESMGSGDPEAPTREEAVQTLLGVARILGSQTQEGVSKAGEPSEPDTSSVPTTSAEPKPSPREEVDSEQVSFDFARGYDEGYQMGRKVGLALGSQKASSPKPDKV